MACEQRKVQHLQHSRQQSHIQDISHHIDVTIERIVDCEYE